MNAADLTLICHECRFPIGDGDGWLRVMLPDIHRYRQQQEAYEAAHPPGEAVDILDMLLGPAPGRWLAYHASCEPEDQVSAYQIASERICTWRQLCHWTAHLIEKNWFAFTDWDCLLREAAGDSEPTTLRVLARAS